MNQERIIKRIEHILTTDNVFTPHKEPEQKAEEVYQQLLSNKGEAVALSSRRYGMYSNDPDGGTMITIYEKSNNYEPDEIVDIISIQ
jgi:hypothetical protein